MLIKKLLQAKVQNRIFVIGIDGLGGAGKTTFTELIKEGLEIEGEKVSVLHIDDFIHPKIVRYDHTKSDWECYYYVQWRYDYLINEILSPIGKGHAIDKAVEKYDKEYDQYIGDHVKIGPETILIIEGIFLQRKEIRSFLDYVIYIDVPQEERLKRVLKRDTYIGDELKITEKYKNRYFPAENRYVKEYAPAENADFIIAPNHQPIKKIRDQH